MDETDNQPDNQATVPVAIPPAPQPEPQPAAPPVDNTKPPTKPEPVLEETSTVKADKPDQQPEPVKPVKAPKENSVMPAIVGAVVFTLVLAALVVYAYFNAK